MGHRDRTFVSYVREDIASYWAMRGWPETQGIAFDFHDAHDLAMGREASAREQRRAVRERLAGTRQVIVLIGARSRSVAENQRGFFALELDVIRGLGLHVVCANLNGARRVETLRLPLALTDIGSLSVPCEPRILRHALDDYTTGAYPRDGPFFYPPEVYAELGI
jgi:antiphage defense system Thoeris ThsB-like protein